MRGFAGSGIVLPAVPGADNLAILYHALADPAAAVQADVINGAVDAVHVSDADGLAFSLLGAGEFLRLVGGGEFGLGGELDEHSTQRSAFSPLICSPLTRLS